MLRAPLLTPILALLTALPAHAADADPADWALPDPAAAVVFRGADALPRLIASTEARFGRAQRVQQVAATLRGWRPGGLNPATGDLGPGLALGRGIGVWLGADGRLRVVFGADDPDAARRTLADYARRLELDATPTDDGFQLPTHQLTCTQRPGFLVCDSADIPQTPTPTTAPKHWLDLHLGPAAIAMSGSDLPFQRARFTIDVTPEAIRGRFDAEIAPHAQGVFATLGDPQGHSRGLGTIDARSPLVLKLSFDSPGLLERLAALADGLDPKLAPLWAGLRRDWSGDLVLSFAPGLLQPILALGLADGRDGAGIIDGLVVALSTDGEDPIKAVDAAGVLRLSSQVDGEPWSLALRHRVIGDALVFALAEPDLDRIAQGRLQRPELPADLADRGTHGVWGSGASALFGPAPLGVFTTPQPEIIALFELLWIQLARLDTAAWILRITGQRATAELSWRLL
ncbi:MAG: hypothetical protein R3F65_28320 [bacterium]